MRTEGIQEVLLKNPALIDNVDRITKMKRVIKAVSMKHQEVTNTRIEEHTKAHDKHRRLVSRIVCFLFPQLSQWKALPTSTPLASIYIKFFGQEIAFANIDKVLIDQAIAV